MFECRKCSKKLQDDWILCPYCGTSVTEKKNRNTRTHGNGIGTAYRRGKTWTAKVIVDWKTVKGADDTERKLPVTRTKGGFKTKAQAVAACGELKFTKAQRQAPTIAHYYDAFTAGKGSQLCHDKQVSYRIAYEKLESVHHTPIDLISVAMLQEIINSKCSTYYPARDVKVLLNHLYKLAAAEGFANQSLPSLLNLPTNNETERKIFTKEQLENVAVAATLGTADEQRGALALFFMVYTGMMPGELRQLEWNMIDTEKREISGAGLKTKERKKRSIVYPEAADWIIDDLRSHGTTEKLFPECEQKFYKEYYAALDFAGIDRSMTPYCCRHTTATNLAITKNVPPEVVKRVMRWSSTKMLDRYAHADDSEAHKAIEKLDTI